ncbi:MAG: biopolymer transporter ExbD [Bdellovibrionales bacterium]|nr:biopolymer transporter ExbD [Bdellovibrionales bacterium]
MSQKRKHLDFELNLIPFIDLLSTCICFLLLTAVWINIGSMNVKQAVGGQAQTKADKKPVLWMSLTAAGDLILDFQDSNHVPKKYQKAKISALEGRPNLTELTGVLAEVRKVQPDLMTALIQPVKSVIYDDIISLMDSCKNSGLSDLGVVPL